MFVAVVLAVVVLVLQIGSVTEAQPAATLSRVGVLYPLSPAEPRGQRFLEALRQGLRELGYVEGCGREHLVPFLCKGRGWCASCGGRRMRERAAHLVDAVLPWVPVRQWVLTVPYRLRYRMAFDPGLSRAVLSVFTRVLLEAYARGAGPRGIAGGRTGSITVIQRAGGGLNVNPHFPYPRARRGVPRGGGQRSGVSPRAGPERRRGGGDPRADPRAGRATAATP